MRTFERLDVDSQELLFGQTPYVSSTRSDGPPLPEDFYRHGYCRQGGIVTVAQCCDLVDAWLRTLDTRRLPLYSSLTPRVQLAKADRIPSCHTSIGRAFQALHWDMGLPLMAPPMQDLYCFVCLWRDPDVDSLGPVTRVVPLEAARVRTGLSAEQVRERMLRYVRAAGDGWLEPEPYNTYRIATFARVFDALYEERELVEYAYAPMGQWFAASDGSMGGWKHELATERAYLESRGLAIHGLEDHVVLEPGELLLIDNVRCVHGRLGNRAPEELLQLLYGVQIATTTEIDSVREHLVSVLARSVPGAQRHPDLPSGN